MHTLNVGARAIVGFAISLLKINDFMAFPKYTTKWPLFVPKNLITMEFFQYTITWEERGAVIRLIS